VDQRFGSGDRSHYGLNASISKEVLLKVELRDPVINGEHLCDFLSAVDAQRELWKLMCGYLHFQALASD
jgi:hypothetical protein